MIRRYKMTGAALCAVLMAALLPMHALAGDSTADTGRKLEITAHRGVCSEAPENTMPAFKAAVDIKADWIELDVTQTKDGVLVVFHDRDLSRITGRPDKIWDMSYEELTRLNVAGKWGPSFRNTRIPSLEEVLDYCKDKIRLDIEIKVNDHQTQDFIPSILSLIRDKGMTEQCMITSFDYGCLQLVKLLEPSMETGYISSKAIAQPEIFCSADNFVLSIDLIEPEAVDRIHALGKKVMVWTVNDEYSVEKCRKAGADNLITDKPKKIMEE